MRPETKQALVRKNSGADPPYLEFIPLTVPSLSHRFNLRGGRSRPPVCPFAGAGQVQAEQVHGKLVVTVTAADRDLLIPAADALVTNCARLTLTIRAADCGPVYLYDPARRAIGLAHSGNRGTALNITAATVSAMTRAFGSRPRDLIVVLGPCIRPPDYEIDFAAAIGRQAADAGVTHYYDCGLNTAGDLAQFYSHRRERGRTGRHYAWLMLNP
ncbi:MAG: polyphenol oxidase family protein [Verrucomicrobiales bacterium]|nr:polyphenol oxidase family protein [Verrucomicrobiales bacterium]